MPNSFDANAKPVPDRMVQSPMATKDGGLTLDDLSLKETAEPPVCASPAPIPGTRKSTNGVRDTDELVDKLLQEAPSSWDMSLSHDEALSAALGTESSFREGLLNLIHARVKTWQDWHKVSDPSALIIDRRSGALTNAVYKVEGPERVTEAIVREPMPVPSAPSRTPSTGRREIVAPVATAKEVALPRRVLLRIYGQGTEDLISREREIQWLKQLSRLQTRHPQPSTERSKTPTLRSHSNISTSTAESVNSEETVTRPPSPPPATKLRVPRLLGHFQNGRFEEWLDAATLTSEDVRFPDVSKAIAKALARLHDLPLVDKVNLSHKADHQRAEIWALIDSYLDLAEGALEVIQSQYKAGEIQTNGHCSLKPAELNIDKLREGARTFKKRAEGLHAPILFCHNDLQPGNIMQDTGEDRIGGDLLTTGLGSGHPTDFSTATSAASSATTSPTSGHKLGDLFLVDFEYAAYNYRGYDIANHFCEWAGDYNDKVNPHVLQWERLPSREQRFRFYRAYLRETDKLEMGRSSAGNAVAIQPEGTMIQEASTQTSNTDLRASSQPDIPSQNKLEELDHEVRNLMPASHLIWGCWSLQQHVISQISFDYLDYAVSRLQRFFEEMEELAK